MGQTGKTLIGTVGKSVVKEVAQDALVGAASSKAGSLVMDVTGDANLSRLAGLGTGILSGSKTGKALNSIDSAVSSSVKTLNHIDDVADVTKAFDDVSVSSKGSVNTKGYSNFADGMSQEDAVRYISNNEEKFYIEFSERASAAGLSNTQISEAYSAMKSGDYSKMASYFNTASPYDGAVFWSGNKIAAGEYAKSIGGTLMEQTAGGKVFDDWRGLQGMYTDWGTGTPFDQKPIWEALSSQYANGANGAVTYVHPDGYYGNVWKNTELPILNERLEDGLINNIHEVIIDGE